MNILDTIVDKINKNVNHTNFLLKNKMLYEPHEYQIILDKQPVNLMHLVYQFNKQLNVQLNKKDEDEIEVSISDYELAYKNSYFDV